MYICMCVYIYVCVCVYMYIYVCVYIYICIYLCVCVYICIYMGVGVGIYMLVGGWVYTSVYLNTYRCKKINSVCHISNNNCTISAFVINLQMIIYILKVLMMQLLFEMCCSLLVFSVGFFGLCV